MFEKWGFPIAYVGAEKSRLVQALTASGKGIVLPVVTAWSRLKRLYYTDKITAQHYKLRLRWAGSTAQIHL